MTRALLLVTLATLGGCILLPPTIRERLAETGGGGSAEGGGGVGGEAQGGSGGGEVTGPLPICDPGEDAGCATIVEIAAGDFHTCALSSDGYVRCWGSNWNGEIGDPSLELGGSVRPHLVQGLSGVDHISAGNNHTCALVGDEAWCWGKNDYSQLGVQDLVDRRAPVKVVFDEPVRQVEAMYKSTCVLSASDEVYCWGFRYNGQNFDGIQLHPIAAKVEGLDDLDGIAEIALGSITACALSSSRDEIRCWGRNTAGSLGDGSGVSSAIAVPTSDALITPVHAIDKGSGTTCTLGGSPRRLQCWGNFTDDLGVAWFEPTEPTSPPSSPLVDLAVGWRHVCSLHEDRFVRCFGLGIFGELGPDAVPGVVYPDPLGVLGSVAELFSGWQHSCVLMDNGQVRCWGRNNFGQTDPTVGDQTVPFPAAIDFSP